MGAMLRNGFPKDAKVLSEGAGVVECESGFSADAHNPSGADGWWQLLGSHPSCSPCSRPDPACSRDLEKSTRTAACIWKSAGNTFARDWTCYHEGIGGPYEKDALRVLANPALGGDAGILSFGTPDLPQPLEQVAKVLERIAQFFAGLGELLLTPEGWGRLAKLIGGALLLAFGINRLAKLSLGVDPAGTAVKGASTLALGLGSGAARIAGAVGLGAGGSEVVEAA
jgi:hypothetical protein